MTERLDNTDFQKYLSEISFGENAHMYSELLRHRDLFDDSTWQYGINSFFIGKSITTQIMERRLLQHVEPEFYTYNNSVFGLGDIDEVRALNMHDGNLRLPKKWDDLHSISQERRMQIGNGLLLYGVLFGRIEPEIRSTIQEKINEGICRRELYSQFRTVPTISLESGLQIYMAQTHLTALSKSLEIVTELREKGWVEENLHRKGAHSSLKDI